MVRRQLLPGIVLTLAAVLLAAAEQPAKVALFPLKDVKQGMKGVGRTVFAGTTVEEFQVEILGVLDNVGPKQSIILARLSGGPLEKTGLMAGMSGSPVYIDGKLVGAVALSFPFSTEPIAGIRPIEQMVKVLERAGAGQGPSLLKTNLHWVPTASGSEVRLLGGLPPLADTLVPAAVDPSVLLSPDRPRLTRIATPLILSGFPSRTLERFAGQFRALGLVPLRGAGSGSSSQSGQGTGEGAGDSHEVASPAVAEAAKPAPGSMISVQLIRGDLGVNADGTITHREGDRIYAFGHRFLSAGPTQMPFSASRVVALLPSQRTSLKISAPGRALGVIRRDRSIGVLGVIGEKARMIPVRIKLRSNGNREMRYQFEIVNDRFLSPFLLQLAVFGTLDATERLVGESSLAIRGTIMLDGLPPVKVENMFAANAQAPMLAALTTAVPLALLLQSGFPTVEVRGVDLEIVSSDRRRLASLDQVWSNKREVRPGERLEITAVLRAEDGRETVKKVPVEIPPSLGPGPLQVTVADGSSLNLAEVRQLPGGFTPKTPAQLVRAINKLRRNNRLYVRLSRPQTAFLLHGAQFPSPPPSLARVMANEPSVSSNIATSSVSTLAESELEPLPSVVTGRKTITVLVKH